MNIIAYWPTDSGAVNFLITQTYQYLIINEKKTVIYMHIFIWTLIATCSGSHIKISKNQKK